jgi:hypothetical protein
LPGDLLRFSVIFTEMWKVDPDGALQRIREKEASKKA